MTVADWSPLKRAMTDALGDCQILLPRVIAVAYIDAVVDLLDAEGVTIAEADPQ